MPDINGNIPWPEFVTSDLPAITTLNGTEKIAGLDADGANGSMTPAILKDYIKGYKEYSIILSQLGTAAPTVDTLLKNELSGPIVWTRTSAGIYVGTLNGAFTVGKTIVTPMSFYSKISGKAFYAYAQDLNTISILARNDAGTLSDLNISQATDFTVKVYN